ncbi:hypothetical protein JM946_11765 [Steroidobacter sp. S1-65]|uniref:Uncharacterized protein n=1 Tax=Steroidobacter gossypii TaxID=2805490 RepID=A0ABS1WWT4_9GAMM|nr:hypothetical protein [Steroidobacter gossypii]MBM0105431.1 hypothetical protein [Steroidobacter gossypii]
MSESTQVIPQIEAADTEVELSAQELLALSDAMPIDPPKAAQALQPSKPTAIVLSLEPDALPASTHRPSRLPVAIIAIVAIAGAAHVLKPSERNDSSSTAPTAQQTSSSQWSDSGQLARGEPVRFTNPFDSQEVFEFPPGTTETEAREAVAAVLKERALSRQNPT